VGVSGLELRFPLLICAFTVALLSACDNGPASDGDPRSKLVGAWQREFEFRGAKGRTVVALGVDRKFTERVELVESDGRARRQEFAGEWSFDGIKFTRRYLQENGRQYSGGRLRFVTLDLTSVTDKQIVGRDNIRGEEVVFQRAEGGRRL
jgi:hypothetical protein